ncbi:MAG: hypothetical protein WCF19_08230 [Chlamydiales bacterium]
MFGHGWRLACLIIIAAFVFLWLVKAPIMSSYLTQKLGVDVSVRMISMWPRQTILRLFTIANPPGFQDRNALEVAKTKIHYRWGPLTATPSEIDLIELENLMIHIEIQNRSGSDNNWAALGARMPEKRGGAEVIIHRLTLKNMTVVTDGPGAEALGVAGTKNFDHMEFTDIDSRDGFPTKELISRIFEGAGLIQYLQNFLNPTERIKDTLNPFGIFGQKRTPENLLEGSLDDYSISP